jgi:hypothetical protein
LPLLELPPLIAAMMPSRGLFVKAEVPLLSL